MTPESQRIAIAEACGWIFDHSRKSYQRQGQWCIELSDYLNDLNAMHEAEKVLTDHQAEKFDKFLNDPTFYIAGDGAVEYAWHATAAQRAEAFLRTLGLWVEEPVSKATVEGLR